MILFWGLGVFLPLLVSMAKQIHNKTTDGDMNFNIYNTNVVTKSKLCLYTQ